MKTEQIMALLADLRSRINPAYAAQFGTESYERRLCAEAIEQLVQERDAAQEAERAQADMRTQDTVLIDNLTRERDELKLAYAECSRQKNELLTKHKQWATECKALRDGIQVYQTQLEKDTSESDLHALMRQGVEIAELKAENKTLRDALTSFTKSEYIKKQHPKRYLAAVTALKGEVK